MNSQAPALGLRRRYIALVLVCLFVAGEVVAATIEEQSAPPQAYIYIAASRDGIGKQYMGREISQVMGHRGAGWLERDNREQDERTDLLVLGLGLKDTDVVADIGAGTGYFAFRMSKLLPNGKVMAVDIQREMLDIISQRATGAEANVVPIMGSVTDINLPENSLDLVLLVDAYHEFSHPREMGESMFRALKPGGRIALVEYRAEDPRVAIKPLHKMSEKQAIREMAALGLHWIETLDVLPQQHLMFFEKPE